MLPIATGSRRPILCSCFILTAHILCAALRVIGLRPTVGLRSCFGFTTHILCAALRVIGLRPTVGLRSCFGLTPSP